MSHIPLYFSSPESLQVENFGIRIWGWRSHRSDFKCNLSQDCVTMRTELTLSNTIEIAIATCKDYEDSLIMLWDHSAWERAHD